MRKMIDGDCAARIARAWVVDDPILGNWMNEYAKRLMALAELGRYRYVKLLSAWNGAQFARAAKDTGGFNECLKAMAKHSSKEFVYFLQKLDEDKHTGPMLRCETVQSFLVSLTQKHAMVKG